MTSEEFQVLWDSAKADGGRFSCRDQDGKLIESVVYIENGPEPIEFVKPGKPVAYFTWQPIETAPKDGRPFDVWDAVSGRRIYDVVGIKRIGDTTRIIIQNPGRDEDDRLYECGFFNITHWMRVEEPR